jgi:hypothetical protein
MTSRTLKIAGWLAMTSAFLTLPLVYLSFKLEGRIDLEATVSQTIIQIFGTVLFVAIILYLRKLLNSLFNFHDTDRNIDLMIVTGAVTGIISTVALYVPSLKGSVEYAVIVILIVQGIVQLQFGYKLLKLPDDLGGMLRPFCYVNMATGIFLASIVLIPMGILASAISDLMLGTIFFSVSRWLKANTVLPIGQSDFTEEK